MSQEFTPAEVATYNKDKLYIIVDKDVYNVTGMAHSLLSLQIHLLKQTAEFLNEHPGGAKILKRVAGKDATKQFWKYHNDSVLKKYGAKLKVGTVKDAAKL